MEIDVQEIMEIFRKSMMLAEAEAAAEKMEPGIYDRQKRLKDKLVEVGKTHILVDAVGNREKFVTLCEEYGIEI